ncbi:phosphatidylserine decarboxylase [Synchytrium microbalum]|uniref:Phosphatidylserine decarboxylase proenzyme 2 n=1 Tax=Synchytrium microbalum TaxID=1806994 RepID=A0A507C429_9FUNG|nr:phosphatidylserine decarboxylase [Synchytrium microbalum]TPX36290.1 phosphatidylserine decarboxylase [Synchytrium microbalum]
MLARDRGSQASQADSVDEEPIPPKPYSSYSNFLNSAVSSLSSLSLNALSNAGLALLSWYPFLALNPWGRLGFVALRAANFKLHTLKVQVIQGRNLTDETAIALGSSSLYVNLTTGDSRGSSQTFQTSVTSNRINSNWNVEFDISVTNRIPTLEILLCDTKPTGTAHFGRLELSLADFFRACSAPMFEDQRNVPIWYPLSSGSRPGQKAASGDLLVKIGLVGEVDQSVLDAIEQVMGGAYYALPVEPAQTFEQLHYEQFTSKRKSYAGSIRVEIGQFSQDSEKDGLVSLDVVAASNLPTPKGNSVGDCNPFVVIGYKQESYRTRVIVHATDPVWNEQLSLHVMPYIPSNQVQITVHDKDHFSGGKALASASAPIGRVIRLCKDEVSKAVANPKTGWTVGISLELTPNLTVAKPTKEGPTHIILRARFVPVIELRRLFLLTYARYYDTNEDNHINRVELQTILDTLGSTLTEESITRLFDSERSLEIGLPFDAFVAAVESWITGPEGHVSGDKDGKVEHIIRLEQCPMCQSPIPEEICDLDLLSHVALCAEGDQRKIDALIMGGFLTEVYPSKKWFTKVLSFVPFQGYSGSDNSILVVDRKTGSLVKEKIPSYIRVGIRLLYQSAISRSAVRTKAIRKMLKSLSIKQGRKFDDPSSAADIPGFIEYHKLNMREVLEPIENFQTFNQFFYRKLKPGARVLASPSPRVAVCPADCRLTAFVSVKDATKLWIKGREFTIAALLKDDAMARRFAGGCVSICRLAPQDYHRFHSPVDGVVSKMKKIEGDYYTVNPMAVRTTVDVYTDNVRLVTYIESDNFGTVAYICVGAMLVGSIVPTVVEGQWIKRMDEIGYFAFGGSTIIVLFEPGRCKYDDDLLSNSRKDLETFVKVGETLGRGKAAT